MKVGEFHPLKHDADESKRDKFWSAYSEKFVSIAKAPSSLSLLKGNVRLCNEFLRYPNGKGKILKLDLWDEAHHTATLTHVAKNYSEVHGIDISPDVVRKASKRLSEMGVNVRGIVGDMRKMPYKDKTFDFVFTMGTIEHIPEPKDAMVEIYRVLKPGGRAVVGVPNKYEWFGKSVALDIFAYFGIKEDGREHSFGWKKLCSDLESCGFRVIKKDGPYFMPWFIRAADWFFAQHAPKMSVLLLPLIKFCDFLSGWPFLLRNGGLLAALVERPFLDEDTANQLEKSYGTPLFVTSKQVIEKNIALYRKGFSAYKGVFTLCYSTKTNSQLAVLELMKKQNVTAEVCSLLDMQSALQAGYTGLDMIHDGLTKTDQELILSVENKTRIINIESMDEAVRLNNIAKEKKQKIDVGIRLAFPSKTGIKSLLGVTYDRFGNNINIGEAKRVAEFIIHSQHLNLVGLHCHTGSNQLSVKKYFVGIKILVETMAYLRDKYSIKISILNLGGGIGISEIVFYSMFDLGKNFLRNMFKRPIVYKFKEDFDFLQLSSKIVKRLEESLRSKNLPYPELMMEPGRALIGNTTDLLLKIINTKKTDVANWLILDGGTNLLPVLTLFSEYHKIDVLPYSGKKVKTSIAGPLLYSADILVSNRLLSRAQIGDKIALRDVGAYCVSQANQFLYPRAATVMLDGEKSQIIQRRETVEDVISRDEFSAVKNAENIAYANI